MTSPNLRARLAANPEGVEIIPPPKDAKANLYKAGTIIATCWTIACLIAVILLW